MNMEKLMQNMGFFTAVIFIIEALVNFKNVMILVKINVFIIVMKILISVLKIIVRVYILRVAITRLIEICSWRRNYLIRIQVTIVAVANAQVMVIKVWVYILFVKRPTFWNAIEHVLFIIKNLVANKWYIGLKMRKCNDKWCKVSMSVGEDCNDIDNGNFSVCNFYNCVYCEDCLYSVVQGFFRKREWQQPERLLLHVFEIRVVTRGENM